MIKITIEFYDRETELMIEGLDLEVPSELIYSATNSQNIEYINAHMFSVSKDMKTYILNKHPDYEAQFNRYDCDFIGRQGIEHT